MTAAKPARLKLPAPAASGQANSGSVLRSFGLLYADVELLHKMVGQLPGSSNSHGDLQVMLSAVRRCEHQLKLLIEDAGESFQ